MHSVNGVYKTKYRIFFMPTCIVIRSLLSVPQLGSDILDFLDKIAYASWS